MIDRGGLEPALKPSARTALGNLLFEAFFQARTAGRRPEDLAAFHRSKQALFGDSKSIPTHIVDGTGEITFFFR